MTPTATDSHHGQPTGATADRGTSTTLDVTLCLLLVSAAVGVLAAAGPPPNDHDPATADHAAERLTTTTHAVTYHPDDDPGTSAAGGTGAGTAVAAETQRTVHGTLATLLARAAVADFAIGDLTGHAGAGSEYARAVRNAVERAVADLPAAVHVTATYAPIANGSTLALDGGVGRSSPEGSERALVGTASAGPAPPADVDVTVVHVQVPVGASATTGPTATPQVLDSNESADTGSFAPLARSVASATVATVLPPARAKWGARDGTTSALVGARYGGLANHLGVDVADALASGDLERATELLRAALAERFESRLRARFDSARAAAAAVDPTTVTITVRTWSP
jgi:hypothetical protein